MLTHYKGTCRPAQTSGPPPSTLSLGRERLLTYYSPARARASFTAYTYTGSARLRNPLPDPDHESLEALRNEGPALHLAPIFPALPRSFFHSYSVIPCTRSLPSRSRFHSLFLAPPLSLTLFVQFSFPHFTSSWPFSEYPSALFTSSLPRVTRPFCVVFLLSSSLILSLSFPHFLSLFCRALSSTLIQHARRGKKEEKRERGCARFLEGVVPSSIATAVSAFLRSVPHARCRYILSV